jgi:hypothetical protein
MRKFAFYEQGSDEPISVTEKEIFDTYYAHWCYEIKKKYLKEGTPPPTEESLCFEHCLEDWMIVFWAWEVK